MKEFYCYDDFDKWCREFDVLHRNRWWRDSSAHQDDVFDMPQLSGSGHWVVAVHYGNKIKSATGEVKIRVYEFSSEHTAKECVDAWKEHYIKHASAPRDEEPIEPKVEPDPVQDWLMGEVA